MSLRVLLAVVVSLVVIPADQSKAAKTEKTKAYFVTVCKKPVALYISHNGYAYFASMAILESDPEYAKKMALMLNDAEVFFSETAEASGIQCPKMITA